MNSLSTRFAVAALTTCVFGAGCGGTQTAETNRTGGTAPSVTQVPSSPAAADAAVDPHADYDKGAALAAAGKLQEARAVFEAASRRDAGDGSVAAGAAMLRDHDAGRISSDVAQKMFRAMQHADAGRWTEAHDDMNDALRLAPRYARAHAVRATLFLFQGQYPNAVEALDQAVALDPQYAEAYYNRGAVRAELKHFDAAIADYNRAIELNPAFWEAYRNRGSAYTHKNDASAAIADYTKTHELRPADGDTIFLRGVVHSAMQHWDAAIADFTKVIAIDPRHAASYHNRGLAYDQKGDVDRALPDYTKSIELEAVDPSPLINRGRIYLGRRDYDRAIADYDRALEVVPHLMLAHFNKAVALDRAGRLADAIEEYRAFLQNAAMDYEAEAAQARRRLEELER